MNNIFIPKPEEIIYDIVSGLYLYAVMVPFLEGSFQLADMVPSQKALYLVAFLHFFVSVMVVIIVRNYKERGISFFPSFAGFSIGIIMTVSFIESPLLIQKVYGVTRSEIEGMLYGMIILAVITGSVAGIAGRHIGTVINRYISEKSVAESIRFSSRVVFFALTALLIAFYDLLNQAYAKEFVKSGYIGRQFYFLLVSPFMVVRICIMGMTPLRVPNIIAAIAVIVFYSICLIR